MRITVLLLVTGLLFSVSADETEKNSNDSSVIELKKMVITASRRVNLVENTPDVTMVINKSEIEAINPQDVSDILEYMPGVSIEGGTGGGLPFKKTININGMPVLYSIIMVDGVRVKSSHIHTGVNVNVVPPGSIERIELIKGAASAQYGSDALGGVLNIITKNSTNKPSLDFSGYYGSNSTMHTGLHVSGPVNSQVSYKVCGAWEKSDGPAILEPASRYNKLFYEKFNFLSRIDVDINEKTATYVSLDYLNSEAPFGSDTAEAWLFTPKIGLDMKLSEKIDFNSIVYYTQWKNQKNNELNEKFEPIVTLGFKGIPKNYLLCGIEGSYNNFMRKRVAEHRQYRAGFFIQDEFTPVTGLTFLGALRFDGIEGVENNDNLFVLSPKVSFLISPHDMLKIRSSYGRGFRAPNVQDLYETLYGHGYYRAGNKNLKPEYSNNIQVGFEINPFKRLSIHLNGYSNFIKNIITPIDKGAVTTAQFSAKLTELGIPIDVINDLGLGQDDTIYIYQRENIHDALVIGGEISMRWNIFKMYNFESGFSITHNENKDTKEGILPYYPGKALFSKLTFSQPFGKTLSLDGYWGIKAVFGRRIWRYKEAQYDTPTMTLEDYQNMEAGISLRFFRKYKFYFSADNLLGQEIEMYEDKLLKLKGIRFFKGGISVSI